MKRLREAGFVDPTPVQRQAVPILLGRHELLAVAPTGSGKARSIRHWSPYDRVRAVNAVPRGLSPAHLSAHAAVSIPALDAFQLHLTPFNPTPTPPQDARVFVAHPGRPEDARERRRTEGAAVVAHEGARATVAQDIDAAVPRDELAEVRARGARDRPDRFGSVGPDAFFSLACCVFFRSVARAVG